MSILWLMSNWRWLLGAAATAVLATLLATTTIDRNQWRAAARKGDATIAKFSVAQKQATAAAQAAHDAQEQRYKDLANAADKDHASALADAGAATDRYISTHRVPACPAGRAAGSASSSASGGSSGIPASLPASSVMVDDTDVHACSDLYAYSVKAHDWAASLGQQR
jgi:hypothetical protein